MKSINLKVEYKADIQTRYDEIRHRLLRDYVGLVVIFKVGKTKKDLVGIHNKIENKLKKTDIAEVIYEWERNKKEVEDTEEKNKQSDAKEEGE
jgi:hypothetical protein